ncbi:MAG TPA: putative ABC exporter domain-containing protein [Steroidobacteraceae bacterium]|jgi:ABC-2 type transport system permease protein|nr:putative ABC exporter domain-containing protein [Steroidobacteraceae bacterium]
MSALSTMARALLYLRATSLLGQLKSRLRRLRQPKYLGGAVVGVGYLYLTFGRRLLMARPAYGAGRPGGGFSPEVSALLPELAALILLVVLIVNWVTPRTASLAFSEAEIAFLFPAPVNRRMLVHYRLLSAQLGIVSSALIFTIVFGRGSGFGGNLWFHAIGWWLILATLNLHFMATSFVYSRLLNRSLTSGRRRTIAIAVAWLLVSGIIVWAWNVMQMPQRSDLAGAHEFSSYVAAQLRIAPVPWLLALPRLLVAPYFAGGGSGFVLALGPAVALLIAHYLWVLNIEVSFEEASIARAEKRGKRLRAVQKGDWRGQVAVRKPQSAPFKLPSQGRPEVAFLWKNLLSSSAIFRPKVAITTLAVLLVGSQWLNRPQLQGARVFSVAMVGIVLAYTLLLGPMMARQDLRAELSNVDLLKTYPLRGWQIVLGELLTPLSILSALIWICLIAGALLLPGGTLTWLSPVLRMVALLGLAVLAPPLVAIQLLVLNAAAVLFPAWMQTAGSRGERGFEVIGQRIIFVAGQLLITVIAAVPAVIGAALVFLVTRWLIGVAAAAVLSGLMAFAVLCVESFVSVLWLGDRFENFDLSAELRV